MKGSDLVMQLPRGTSALQTLLAGLGLGVAADFLLWDAELAGPGLSIWIALLGAAALVLNREAEMRWRVTVVAWSAVALAATLILILRASEVLIPLMLLVLVTGLATITLQASGWRLADTRVSNHFLSVVKLPPRVGFSAIPLLGRIELRHRVPSQRARGIGRGILITLPLLLIFILLFSSADATFNRYASQLTELLSLSLPKHLLIVAIFSWLASGLLLCAFRQPPAAVESQGQPWQLGAEETAVVMGSLAILFLVFVVLQAGYLFGGRETIEMTSGLTLSDYARRGFFELVVVAGLTLAVLLAMAGLQSAWSVFRPLALVLVLCVLVILASAAQRLALYTAEFGLTLARVIAVAFMVWLGGVLVAFAATILRGQARGFAAGMALSGVAMALLLGLANPAAVVARVNIDRAIDGGSAIDVNYLANLGADAVPALLENLDSLPERAQCIVATHLLYRWGRSEQQGQSQNQDWRSWNFSRWMARARIQEYRDRLQSTIGNGTEPRGSQSAGQESALAPWSFARMC